MKRFFKYLCAFIVFFGFTAKAHAGLKIDLIQSKTLNDYLCNGSNYCVCHRINNAGTTYKVGRLRDGSNKTLMAYCFNHALEAPYLASGNSALYYETSLTSHEKTWANSFIYILKNGWNGSSWNRSDKNGSKEFTKEEKYYVTQLAIWGLQGSAGVNLDTLKPYNSCNGIQANMIKAAKNLLNDAKKNKNQTPLEINLSAQSATMKLSSDGKYYQTGTFKVTGSGFNTYTVHLTKSPSGTEIYIPENKKTVKNGSQVNKGKNVIVRIPVSQVKNNDTIKLEVRATGSYKTLKKFKTDVKCTDVYGKVTKCQDMGMFISVNDADKAAATIELKPTGGFEVEKVDENGKRLGGAVLVVKNAKGKQVAKWNTSKENPKKFSNLPIGARYTIYEEVAPKGYKKLGSQTVVEVKVAKTQLIRLRNFKTTPFIVSKRDITNKTEVPGATLAIYNAVTQAEVDSWVSKSEPHYVQNIPAGSYILKEISAPEGYIQATGPVRFTVDSNGNVKLVNYTFNMKSSYELVGTNELAIYNKPYDNIPISKQDATNGKELPGATLVLKDSTGKQIDKWVSGTTPHYVKLKQGTYTLEETIAPVGYVKTTEKITFTINAQGKVNKKVVMKNSPKPPVYISKQDATTGKELPGATLVLKNSLGTIIEEWVSTETPHVISKVLEQGDYTLSETIAPKGYQTTTETVKFTVNANGTVDKPVVMKNKPTTQVKISKRDLTTGKELPGATMVVKNEKGKVVDKWVSKSKPHYLPALPDGKYYLSETKAPDGYIKTEEVIDFNLKNNGVEQTVVMTNEKIPVTADIPLGKIISGVVVALVCGAAVFYKIGRQNLNAE